MLWGGVRLGGLESIGLGGMVWDGEHFPVKRFSFF